MIQHVRRKGRSQQRSSTRARLHFDCSVSCQPHQPETHTHAPALRFLFRFIFPSQSRGSTLSRPCGASRLAEDSLHCRLNQHLSLNLSCNAGIRSKGVSRQGATYRILPTRSAPTAVSTYPVSTRGTKGTRSTRTRPKTYSEPRGSRRAAAARTRVRPAQNEFADRNPASCPTRPSASPASRVRNA